MSEDNKIIPPDTIERRKIPCYRCGNELKHCKQMQTRIFHISLLVCSNCFGEEISMATNLGFESNPIRELFAEWYDDRNWEPTKECVKDYESKRSNEEDQTS